MKKRVKPKADHPLIARAVKSESLETELETVGTVSRKELRNQKQMEIIKLFGTVEYDPAYDYKRERSRK